MTVLQILMSVLLLAVLPTVVGCIFRREADGRMGSVVFRWISGQILLWALFQLICVPAILMETDFPIVVYGYNAMLSAAVLAAVALGLKNRKKISALSVIKGFDRKKPAEFIFWGLFWALLLFQMVQAVRMAYADGDDAFYVATSSITQNAETMYRKLPYTGYGTELDVRHGLAPFPIWIAWLARLTGIQAATMAHVVVPVALIPMTYGIFYLLGTTLLQEKREKLPLFLVFTELLVLFGDYSFYTAENFMIARSRQGKAALGSIVIPMLLLLLLAMLGQLQERGKISLQSYALLVFALTAGCLCSTMGAMLCCLLVGIAGLCAAVAFKKWKFLFPMALCCLPDLCYAAIYLIKG